MWPQLSWLHWACFGLSAEVTHEYNPRQATVKIERCRPLRGSDEQIHIRAHWADFNHGGIDLLRHAEANLERQHQHVHERRVARLSCRGHAAAGQAMRSLAKSTMVSG